MRGTHTYVPAGMYAGTSVGNKDCNDVGESDEECKENGQWFEC